VYQFLLTAGGGTQPVTVALIALASGIILNVLLERARKEAARLFDGSSAQAGAGRA
jgi:hypothetical protein